MTSRTDRLTDATDGLPASGRRIEITAHFLSLNSDLFGPALLLPEREDVLFSFSFFPPLSPSFFYFLSLLSLRMDLKPLYLPSPEMRNLNRL